MHEADTTCAELDSTTRATSITNIQEVKNIICSTSFVDIYRIAENADIRVMIAFCAPLRFTEIKFVQVSRHKRPKAKVYCVFVNDVI